MDDPFDAGIETFFKTKSAVGVNTPEQATTDPFEQGITKFFGTAPETVAAPEAQNTPAKNNLLQDIGAGLRSGALSSAGAAATALGANETAKAFNQSATETPISVPSFTDVHSVGDAAKFTLGNVASAAPEMGITAAPIIAGGLLGGPVGGIIGTGVALAGSLLFNTGRNLQRQDEENVDRDEYVAFGAGFGQAILDRIGMGKGLGLIGDALGIRIAGAVAKKGIAREIVRGARDESVTEVIQQAIEIGQAKPDLLRVLINPKENEVEKSDQLVEELVNAALIGGAAGGVFTGAAAGVSKLIKDDPAVLKAKLGDAPLTEEDLVGAPAPAAPATPAPSIPSNNVLGEPLVKPASPPPPASPLPSPLPPVTDDLNSATIPETNFKVPYVPGEVLLNGKKAIINGTLPPDGSFSSFASWLSNSKNQDFADKIKKSTTQTTINDAIISSYLEFKAEQKKATQATSAKPVPDEPQDSALDADFTPDSAFKSLDALDDLNDLSDPSGFGPLQDPESESGDDFYFSDPKLAEILFEHSSASGTILDKQDILKFADILESNNIILEGNAENFSSFFFNNDTNFNNTFAALLIENKDNPDEITKILKDSVKAFSKQSFNTSVTAFNEEKANTTSSSSSFSSGVTALTFSDVKSPALSVAPAWKDYEADLNNIKHDHEVQNYIQKSWVYPTIYNSAWYKAAVANPKFQEWFAGAHPAVTHDGTNPIVLFHGANTTVANKVGLVAEEQGITTGWFSKVSKSVKGKAVGGPETQHPALIIYTSNNITKASSYMWHSIKKNKPGALVPLFVNFKKPLIHNHNGLYSPDLYNKLLNIAVEGGFDGVILRNTSDNMGTVFELITNAAGKVVKNATNDDPFNTGYKGSVILPINPAGVKSVFNTNFGKNQFYSYAKSDGTTATGARLTEYEFKTLREALNKMGLSNVKLSMLDPNNPDAGKWRGYLEREEAGLRISVLAADGKAILHHEAIHALKELGLFTEAEWAVLRNAAINESWIDKYNINANYPELSYEKKLEEAIAHEFENNIRTGPQVKTVFDKIANFFKALINWSRGLGFNNVEDIFYNIASGELALVTKAKLSQDKDVTSGENARNNIIAFAKKLNLPAPVMQNIQQAGTLADKYDKMYKFGFTILQLADRNPHISWLRTHTQLVARWFNEKMKWTSRASETLRLWQTLGKADADKLSDFIFDVEQMNYRTPGEVKAGVIRQPTAAELRTLAKRYAFQDEDNALRMYVRIRKDFEAVLGKMEEVILNDVQRLYPGSNNPLAAIKVQEIQTEFDTLRARPYFPHARFGEFTAVVKDNKGDVVYMEQFATKKEQKSAYGGLRAKYPATQGYTLRLDKIPDQGKAFQGLPPSLIASIEGQVLDTLPNLSSQDRAKLEDFFRGLKISFSPAESFKKHFAKRKNISGYSRDAMRAYADYFHHGASHIARLEYGPQMRRNIDEAGQATTALGDNGFDVTRRREIIDHVTQHTDYVLNPPEEWAALRSIAFTWWLGFSPASAALNLTQVPMVTLPYLSSRFGEHKTIPMLAKVTAQIQKLFAQPNAQNISTEDERQISLAVEQGFVDESMATELAATAEGTLSWTASNTWVGRNIRWAGKAAGYMFEQTEKLNRRVTFRMGVELARQNPDVKHRNELIGKYDTDYKAALEKGMSPLEAFAFISGKDAVITTQFEYAAWARPRFMQGRPSVFFTFFSFAQNMLFFSRYGHGRGRYLLLLLAMAGVMGLPGAEDLEALTRFLGRNLFNTYYSPKEEIRAFMIEMFGEDSQLAETALYGAGRTGFGLAAAGAALGMPVPEINMSGAIGLGRIIPGATALGPATGDFNDRVANSAKDIGGASFAILFGLGKFLSAGDQYQLNDLKRWEMAMPRALRDMSQAVRFAEEGRERSASGSTVLDFDIEDPEQLAEVIARAGGFQVTRLSRRWDRIIAQADAQSYWTGRRTALMGVYDEARWRGTEETRKEIIDRIVAFNREAPKGLAITRQALQQSLARRDLARAKQEAGVPQSKMLGAIYRDVARRHPEDAPTVFEEGIK